MFFHDHMRGRGTSLNFADLASDPPPANLQVDTTTHAFHTCAHQIIAKLLHSRNTGDAQPITSCARILSEDGHYMPVVLS